jgi:hypothetical protein
MGNRGAAGCTRVGAKDKVKVHPKVPDNEQKQIQDLSYVHSPDYDSCISPFLFRVRLARPAIPMKGASDFTPT